jgi:hypothetical protein
VACGDELEVAETHICSPWYIGSRSGSPWSVLSDCLIVTSKSWRIMYHFPRNKFSVDRSVCEKLYISFEFSLMSWTWWVYVLQIPAQ